ncbi:MAG: M23 family metallopeptidase [Pseudomonadota bacterium]
MFKPHDEHFCGPPMTLQTPTMAGSAARSAFARVERLKQALGKAPDLAQDIGTRRWYRRLAAFAALTAFTLAFWPDFSHLQAAPAARLDRAAQEEFRSQAVMPLGYDRARGRRVAAGKQLRLVSAVPERPRVELAGVVAEDDSLDRLLVRFGASMDDSIRAAALVNDEVPADRLSPGTRVAVTLGARPGPGRARPLERLDLRARFDLALAITRRAGTLVVTRNAIPVDIAPMRVRGTVGQSLYRSARAAGAPAPAIQQYLQALDVHLSLENDIRPGDTFDLVFAHKRAATGETEPGDLLYAGLDRGDEPVAELLRWGRDSNFYAADALDQPSLVQTGPGLLAPVNGRITSLFGQRSHPILGYTRMHAGVDFGAPWGAPIIAAADGTVSYAGYRGGHGNYVRLEHGGGLGTGYGHMSRLTVAAGERVRAGELIGFVGSTGLSTGPHLHYEVYQGGRTVDPLGLRFAVVQRQVDPQQLGAFRAKLAQLKALRAGGTFAGAHSAVQRIALR